MHKYLLLVLILFGCNVASPTEMNERKLDAFDLAGTWHGSGGLQLVIVDEHGRDDVRVTVTRNTLSSQETSLLTAQGVDVAQATAILGSLVIGQGAYYVTPDVQSKDNGVTSELFVGSSSIALPGGRAMGYSIYATIAKKDFVLRGSLDATLSWPEQSVDKNGKSVTVTKSASTSVPFDITNDAVVAQQYLGHWTGDVQTDVPGMATYPVLRGIDLLPVAGGFQALPTPPVVTVDGGTFTAVQITQPLTDLLTDWPAVQIYYAGATADNLLLSGHVYSLGELDGTLVHVGPAAAWPVVGFRFARK